MPTTRQRKLAKVIIENSSIDKPLNNGQMLEKVGYSKSVADAKSGEILSSEGVQNALSEFGFSEENAKKVVHSIMMNEEVDPNARLKATDQVFKVRGSYAAEKHVSLNLTPNITKDDVNIAEIAAKVAEDLKNNKLNDSNTGTTK